MEAPAWEHKDAGLVRALARAAGTRSTSRDRIDLLVAEMQELIALLERKTDRRFDTRRLAALMERINEQEGYIAEAAALVGSARPCPVSIIDQMPNTMIPQWHRGSDWAVAHARRFRDEVRERVRGGRRRRRERAAAADVDRCRPVARHRVLPGARRAARRRVRLVDVHAVRRSAVHPRTARAAVRGAREPHLLDERGAAPAAVDE